jgi:hypothetical protein
MQNTEQNKKQENTKVSQKKANKEKLRCKWLGSTGTSEGYGDEILVL